MEKGLQIFKNIVKIFLGLEPLYFRQTKIDYRWFGSKYAGFYVCPLFLNSESVVFSFGVGEDTSFDQELISNFNLTVYGFDPTPKSIKYVHEIKLNNFIFFDFGLYNFDGFIKFYLPFNNQQVSGAVSNRWNENEGKLTSIEVPVKKFSTIITNLQISKIDILKMDIEGSEYEVIDDILESPIKIKQILIEFHHRFPNRKVSDTKSVIKKMNMAGYKIFAISSNLEEYSFINT